MSVYTTLFTDEPFDYRSTYNTFYLMPPLDSVSILSIPFTSGSYSFSILLDSLLASKPTVVP